MLVIQIILLIFFTIAFFKVIKRYRKKNIPLGEALLWSLFWIVAGVVVIWPDTTFFLAHLVGVGRGADLIVYGAIALLFFIVFRLTVKLEVLDKHITLLTRQKALEEKQNKSEIHL